MKKAISRNRVKGFLDVQGRRIVNEDGEDVLLVGWGLGNWLLCEGYMWGAGDVPRFDRPRRIEAVIEELAGKAFAERFWKQYRDSYITREDIRLMAEMGYNSLRVPINARLFLQEGPGIHFLEEGFQLLDRLIDWCEEYGLYVFIDLHAAPGGQTGANIDDSVDDVCRLFADPDQFEKGLALWERLAQRYAERWIVGGYDLLNEPIRPTHSPQQTDQDMYLPRLEEFYTQCIARIRRHDQRHIVALEGHHWASDTAIFTHVYDPKMVISFHRYACAPDMDAFKPFLDVSERLNVPLWLSETGENTMEWFSAMMPLALRLNIGISMWPWKKLDCVNSPCSIPVPEGWDQLIQYARGGAHPAYARAQKILTAYLNSMRVENCTVNDHIRPNVFRIPGCTIAGTDFDALPGQGASFLHLDVDYPAVPYRKQTGMQLYRRFTDRGSRFTFDGEWAQYILRLSAGEFVTYSLYDVSIHTGLEIHCYSAEPSSIEVYQDEHWLGSFDLSATAHKQILAGLHLVNADVCAVRVTVTRGVVDVESLTTDPEAV